MIRLVVVSGVPVFDESGEECAGVTEGKTGLAILEMPLAELRNLGAALLTTVVVIPTATHSDEPMQVYRFSSSTPSCASYHVAARDITQATAAFLEGAKDFEDAESLDGGFTVQKVPSAVWMTWTCDKASFADLVSKTREAAVLTGSEWP